MTTTMPPVSYEQTARVLKKLANLEHPIVLVGGQAVNFWAEFYENEAPQLADHAPYMSKDIDFMGSPDAVRECAKRLGGTAKVATLDDMNTPQHRRRGVHRREQPHAPDRLPRQRGRRR